MLRHLLLTKGMYFSRYFFKKRESRNFIVNSHHILLDNVMDRVYSGEIKRLIINMPPGYTKTEEAVIKFISRGFAINPQSLFIHLSYSDELALWNSTQIKDVIEMSEYRELFPTTIRRDVNSKKKWYTEEGGGLYATAAGGQVTGFRAGRMIKNIFSGALVLDDLIKPQDAHSGPLRKKINDRFNSTFKSRLALEDTTPIILIMQRIHEDDPSGFLLRGGTGEKWHHLILPMNVPEEPIHEWYSREYTHGIPIEYELPPGPLWEFKHNEQEIKILEKTSPYDHASQNQQMPTKKGGTIFKEEFWRFYSVIPMDIKYKAVFCDTATKKNTHNDYTVFQCWGYSPTFGIFLLGQKRKKMETTELESELKSFFDFHNTMKTGQCTNVRYIGIEDKSSGTGLIQTFRKNTKIPVLAIPRNIDKVMRAMDGVPQISSGNVFLPDNEPWVREEYIPEFSKFTPLMTHKNDDQIDVTLDAIDKMLINKNDMVLSPSHWRN